MLGVYVLFVHVCGNKEGDLPFREIFYYSLDITLMIVCVCVLSIYIFSTISKSSLAYFILNVSLKTEDGERLDLFIFK